MNRTAWIHGLPRAPMNLHDWFDGLHVIYDNGVEAWVTASCFIDGQLWLRWTNGGEDKEQNWCRCQSRLGFFTDAKVVNK